MNCNKCPKSEIIDKNNNTYLYCHKKHKKINYTNVSACKKKLNEKIKG